ncbi:hypothetical protein Illi2_00204 [Pseudomonas phage vB_PpuM-Illi-2]
MSRAPVRNRVYTLGEIIDDLFLRDTPCLLVYVGDGGSPIKSYYPVNYEGTYEEMRKLPGWEDSRWTFTRETSEWIPVFHWDNDQGSPSQLVQVTRSEYFDLEHTSMDRLIVTPKEVA